MNNPKHSAHPSNRSPDKTDGSDLPNATLHLWIPSKKINFQWHPEAGAGGGSRDRGQMDAQGTPWAAAAHGAGACSPIDSPWLLQSDQFCIQSRARVNLLLLGKFPAEREVDLQSCSSWWLAPSHAASPPRCRGPDLGAAALRVTPELLALLAFPRGTIWPRFLFFRLLGTERGRERGEVISNITSSHHAEPKPFITLGLVPPSQGRGDTSVGHKGQSHLAVLWMLWHSYISHCIREKVSPPVGTTVKPAPVWHLPEHTHRARRSLPPSPAQGQP